MSLFPQKGRHQERAPQRASSDAVNAEKKRSPGRRRSNRALKVAGILLCCGALLILLGIVVYNLWSKAPEVSQEGLKTQAVAAPPATAAPAAPALPSSPEDDNGQEPEETPAPALRRPDVYTLLVVGRDRVGMNTDTIMVVRMDCAEKTVDAVSIPRDTLVNVPWSVKKANSIYGNLGLEGLVDGVEDLVGFPIDSYVIVNTYVFQQVIDSIGGVYFDVPIYMIYDDPDQNLHIWLTPGYQLLSGYQAEQVVRFRQNNDGSGYPNGDLGRIETQHAFFTALAKQVLSLGNIANLPSLIDLVVSNTDTNLTSGNIAFYAQEFLKMDSDSIRFHTMPSDTVYILGGSYVSIQLEPWLEMVNEYLNPFNTDVTAENLDVITCSDAGFASTTGTIPSYGEFFDYSSVVE